MWAYELDTSGYDSKPQNVGESLARGSSTPQVDDRLLQSKAKVCVAVCLLCFGGVVFKAVVRVWSGRGPLVLPVRGPVVPLSSVDTIRIMPTFVSVNRLLEFRDSNLQA